MQRYLVQRLIAIVPVLGVVAVIVFGLLRLTPGDPAAIMLGDGATPQAIHDLRQQLGLDEPLPIQFFKWIGGALRGDLGRSIFFNETVTGLIVKRIEPTVLLTVYALLLASLVGIPVGTIAAVRRGSLLDRALMVTSLVGISAPSFLIGLLLILVVAVQLRWLPSGGYKPLSDGLLENFRSMALPATALGLAQFALIARTSRTAVLEVLGADYIRVAVAKGLAPHVVLIRHILRNAFITIITIIGLSFAVLMGGTVVIETLFDIPGVGRLVIEAVLRRDYPVIQGAVLYVTCMIVLINVGVDLLYSLIDPRIRY